MSYEYDDEDYGGGRVLWSRIAFAIALLLLAFVLGRCSEGGGGAELESANQRVIALSSENEQLQNELDAATGGGGTQTPSPGTTETGSTAPTESTPQDNGDAAAEGEQTYVVVSGDTLSTIAQDTLGDASRFVEIAQRNGIDTDAALQVGDELIIPADGAATSVSPSPTES